MLGVFKKWRQLNDVLKPKPEPKPKPKPKPKVKPKK